MRHLATIQINKENKMRHLATIQTEFLKEAAAKWDKLSIEQQKAYLEKHPKSKKKITAKPKQLENIRDKIKEKKDEIKEKKQDDIPKIEGEENIHEVMDKLIKPSLVKKFLEEIDHPENYDSQSIIEDFTGWLSGHDGDSVNMQYLDDRLAEIGTDDDDGFLPMNAFLEEIAEKMDKADLPTEPWQEVVKFTKNMFQSKTWNQLFSNLIKKQLEKMP